MSVVRRVKLLPEVEQRLKRYAEIQHVRPEDVIAKAVEVHLREYADVALRIADARETFLRHQRLTAPLE